MSEKKEAIAALWLKESQKGMKYMSGNFKVPEGARAGDTIDIVVFKNDKGDNPKRPDYRVFVSEKREESQSSKSFDDDDLPPF